MTNSITSFNWAPFHIVAHAKQSRKKGKEKYKLFYMKNKTMEFHFFPSNSQLVNMQGYSRQKIKTTNY